MPDEIIVWKARAEEITAEIIEAVTLEDKKRLITRYKNHWRNEDLVNWLSSLSDDKCWYTEAKFGGDNQEIEHFRPKGQVKDKDGNVHDDHDGYNWLAFDLDNYRLCKGRPNRRKSTFFPIIDERNRAISEEYDWRDETPLFLDPIEDEDPLFITFDENGIPAPEDELEDQDQRRVEFTIDKYFLDDTVLNRRRALTWSTCRELYYSYQHKMHEAKNAPNDRVRLRTEAKKDLETLKSLLMSDKEFSKVARCSIEKIGDRFARNLVSSI
ncbi:hypothetical protein [Colwellia psychrerythraea]|uniref:hypothetical protein n=1 Tax=Colwellia psychrerythraea TaxID=28229 RepID=UPI0012E0850A|nr:hypothetical protein [Colwellia psychrerythraea]